MAKIKQKRDHGTLSVLVVPSLDHPEEPAIQLSPGQSIRIHGINGGYLFSLVAHGDGKVMKYYDGKFFSAFDAHVLGMKQIEEQTKSMGELFNL